MKNYLPLGTAAKVAEKVAGELQPFCDRIAIAGSVRREKLECGDIDLVVESPKTGFQDRLLSNTSLISDGNHACVARMHWKGGFDIEIYYSQASDHDLFGKTQNETWGSVLLCRTGSINFNARLAVRAQDFGMHWNPQYGLYRNGKQIASVSEESIFDALEWEFVPPNQR